MPLDLIEEAALKKLSERDLWAVDELPQDIDIDILRCLDEAQAVQARAVIMTNQQKYFGDPAPPAPVPMPWCSPLRSPGSMGDWDAVLRRRPRNEQEHPYEIRVSQHGQVLLARASRPSSPPKSPTPTSDSTTAMLTGISRAIRELPTLDITPADHCERGGRLVEAALLRGVFGDPSRMGMWIAIRSRLDLPRGKDQPDPHISAWMETAYWLRREQGLRDSTHPTNDFVEDCEIIARAIDVEASRLAHPERSPIDAFKVGAGSQVSTRSQRPVGMAPPNPTEVGWTRDFLVRATKRGGGMGIGASTFNRLRRAAEIPAGKKGRKFSSTEVQRMLDCAPAVVPQSAEVVLKSWSQLLAVAQ